MEAAKVEKMLDYISSDSYDDWIRVGMGLKSEFGSNGLPLWDSWSQSSKKYDSSEIARKWDSFRSGGIGIGTILYIARESGFTWSRSNEFTNRPKRSESIDSAPEREVPHKSASQAWETCNKSDNHVSSHPYKPKLRGAYGAGRIQGEFWGYHDDYLLVPCFGIDTGILVGVETINRKGKKLFLGRKNGCLILGNDLQQRSRWRVYEGWATAATGIQEGFVETAVIAFGGKSRQIEIAKRVHKKYGSQLRIELEQDL